jgi:gliding motility-associated lipoprotein GldD
MPIKKLFILIIFSCFIVACSSDESFLPKPRGYFRITLPKHEYKLFNPENCPFSFEIPVQSYALPDTNGNAEKCWYYILLPQVNGQLYFTYKAINGDANKFIEDTRTLVYKHTTKASSIDESLIQPSPGVSGIIYDIAGDAASPVQFFVTDSTKNFLRGALYFNVEPNSDSLAPVVNYTKKDIEHLIGSIRWK